MSFDEFVTCHLAAMQRFAAVLAGDRIRGDDVVQEVMVRTHARWRRIGALDRPEFYVRKMIVNEFLASRRRLWWLVPGGSSADVDNRVSPDHATRHADRQLLVSELVRLPRQQRAVLVLRYYEGLSDPEIADVLGIAPGTVRAHASRALAALRIEMTDADRTPQGEPTRVNDSQGGNLR